nr:MAG TPA: hypothetical protein [Caudoviricetes sp.]
MLKCYHVLCKRSRKSLQNVLTIIEVSFIISIYTKCEQKWR